MTLTENEKSNEKQKKPTEDVKAEKTSNTSEKASDKKASKSKCGNKTDKKSKENEKLSDTDFLKGALAQELEREKKLEEEKAVLKAENDHLNALITQAKEKLESINKEYENYRRRTTLEKKSIGTDATCKAVKALLPALDNLERAMPFADSNPDSFKTGVGMTLNQLEEAFKSLGVEEIEANGKEFDANLHDVVMHEEDPEKGDSIITDVFQKGYKLGDKVIRHSAVKVVN